MKFVKIIWHYISVPLESINVNVFKVDIILQICNTYVVPRAIYKFIFKMFLDGNNFYFHYWFLEHYIYIYLVQRIII